MDVVEMAFKVALGFERVFREPALPNATSAFVLATGADRLFDAAEREPS
jgi:hypothetical protein